MQDEPNLFELPTHAEATGKADSPISEQQIRQLRTAFEAAGMNSMDERRELIESCTIRPVASIRELYARDFRPILRRIEQRTEPALNSGGSAWDNRDEDTWIDRL